MNISIQLTFIISINVQERFSFWIWLPSFNVGFSKSRDEMLEHEVEFSNNLSHRNIRIGLDSMNGCKIVLTYGWYCANRTIVNKVHRTLLRRSFDEISVCKIVCESFLQSRSSNTTTRSLSPVTEVRSAACIWEVYATYMRSTTEKTKEGRTRKRAEEEKTRSKDRKGKRTDTE